MLVIKDILISDEILEEFFHCNLEACRGACCWEGDFGAPLEEEEINIMNEIVDKIKPFLPERSIALLEKTGFHQPYPEMEENGTSLHPDGACVFLAHSADGGYRCGIELAYESEIISFQKPISCHLYPIRRKKNKEVGFEAMNYDQWEICNPACALGKQMQLPLYKFAEKAIKRLYGDEFYQELEAAAQYMSEKKSVK
jgi:hypothetical protein